LSLLLLLLLLLLVFCDCSHHLIIHDTCIQDPKSNLVDVDAVWKVCCCLLV
jgi:hypothetical protein